MSKCVEIRKPITLPILSSSKVDHIFQECHTNSTARHQASTMSTLSM